MGVTGLSCARYFRSLGETFSIADSRENPPGLDDFVKEFPEQTPMTGPFHDKQFCEASELVVSPGVSLKTPAVKAAIDAGVFITGDIDIFSRAASAPVVAVTGSNGKSTVVSLLGEMARHAGLHVAVGGNLDGKGARPALDLLSDKGCDLYVLELSSFQLETTHKLGAKAVAVLNISEDHMDRYDDMDAYAGAKHRIFNSCEVAIINRQEPSSYLPAKHEAVVVSIGLDSPGQDQWGLRDIDGEAYLARGEQKLLRRSEVKMPGKHNVVNALTALALGEAVGLPLEKMLETLKSFAGLPHRCEWVAQIEGVQYFNDSKGTNVGASITAIESVSELISGKIVLIAGGLDKDSDFSVMAPVLEKHVSAAVLIGQDAETLATAFRRTVPVVLAQSMSEAVLRSSELAQAGDAVLLSPACASFDMFKGYADRGEAFCNAVEDLS
ncbi:MAG: UDP-N-acetylmuramoyl-L-alanine--D-glutamate ligase [Pseudohongiellaceae bacterium]|nr:UDP-N-acetylmuramoyl-L-alanine--D-glutamate ligase [Pseudohongiellaceae bacterium]